MIPNNPAFAEVLAIINKSGLNYSGVGSKTVIVEFGFSDYKKAFLIRAFRAAISGGTGDLDDFARKPHDLQNIVPAMKALLAHVVNVLQGEGAVLKSKEEFSESSIEEIYHLQIKDQDIDLILIPRRVQ